MRVALDAGLTPHRFALGAAAALETLSQSGRSNSDALEELWQAPDQPPGRKSQLIHLITKAQAQLKEAKSNYGKF